MGQEERQQVWSRFHETPRQGDAGMRWQVEFYHEKRGILARYGIEAALPAAAVLLGRNAVFAEYPSARARRGLSLLERAQRAQGPDGSGGVLYPIPKDN